MPKEGSQCLGQGSGSCRIDDGSYDWRRYRWYEEKESLLVGINQETEHMAQECCRCSEHDQMNNAILGAFPSGRDHNNWYNSDRDQGRDSNQVLGSQDKGSICQCAKSENCIFTGSRQ